MPWMNGGRPSGVPSAPDAFEAMEPVDPRPGGSEEAPFDADEFYALSVLHMTVGRVHKHLLEEGKSEHWMIFEELVLAPLIPGRVPKTREELLAMFPGQGPVFLDNRVTTVKRVFRRILPALIPADPTENLTSEERFQELLEILHASKNNRLWLAFLTNPMPGPEESPGSSLDLAAPPSAEEMPGRGRLAGHSSRRAPRSYWGSGWKCHCTNTLTTSKAWARRWRQRSATRGPAGPLGRRARRRSAAQSERVDRRARSHGRRDPARGTDGIAGATQDICEARPPLGEARRQGRPRARRDTAREFDARSRSPRSSTISPERWHLTRCNARIIGLGDDRYRKNVSWVLNQSWLETRLRPVFFAALQQLDAERKS